MRWTPFVLSFAACTADRPDCASGMHEEAGECVADVGDDTDDPTTPVGNDLDLDRYPPVVISTTPASGTLGVDDGLDGIEVTFSKAMAQDRWSWVQTTDDFPDFSGSSVTFVDDDTNAVSGMGVDADAGYLVWINDPYGAYSSFEDEDGLAALAYPIPFATGADPALIASFPAGVTASVPIAGSEGVDPTLGRIEVVFGKDMDDAALGFAQDTAPTFPEVVAEGFSDPRTAWADVVLEPSTTYAIRIEGFVDADGVPAAPWLLTFRTAD